MASILKLKSGAWRVQIRRKGQYVSRSFRLQSDARQWARDVELRIDLGQTVEAKSTSDVNTVGDPISLHISDMCEVGRAPLRSKSYCLEKLARELGQLPIRQLDRTTLVGSVCDELTKVQVL